jgi:hypothetical protein
MTHTSAEYAHPLSVAIIGGSVWSPRLSAAPPEITHGLDWTRRLDPLSVRAVQCVLQARHSANLPIRCQVPNQEGVCVGTGWGAQQTRIRYATRLVTHGISGTNPIDFPDSIDGAPAAHVALQGSFQGPSLTFVGGADCAYATLVTAARQLELRLADRMHVVLGDLYDSRVEASATGGPVLSPNDSPAGPADARDLVIALVLERLVATGEHSGCPRLVGYEAGRAVAGRVDSVAIPSATDSTGAEGVCRVAGAWLGLTDPMGYRPFACQDELLPDGSRCCALTNPQWPHLALVRP